MLDWNDLRFVLAVAREGSTRRAATVLQVNHATVSRHITEITEHLGVRLFDRDAHAWVPTEAGADLIGTAEQVEQEVLAVERRIAGRDARPRGVVRISLPPSFVAPLGRVLHELRERYPEIQLELSTSLQFANLTKREADIAIRVTDAPPDTLIGRPVGTFVGAAFGHCDLLARIEPCDLEDYPWIAWDERFDFKPDRWLRTRVDRSAIVARGDSESSMVELVKAALGVAVLPVFLAGVDPELRRLSAPVPEFDYGVWVLTHPDLMRTTRVRVAMRAIGDAMQMQSRLFGVG